MIGECQPRHRHQEFLRFLNRIDESVQAGLDIHLVLDNYGTHKDPAVKNGWLGGHAITCTSLPPAHRGSIRSSAGSRKLHARESVAARSARHFRTRRGISYISNRCRNSTFPGQWTGFMEIENAETGSLFA